MRFGENILNVIQYSVSRNNIIPSYSAFEYNLAPIKLKNCKINKPMTETWQAKIFFVEFEKVYF